MSILQYQIYLENCLKLFQSMIVKHHPTALLINSEIKLQSGVTGVSVNELDMSTWKYYMNMAGLYHELDVPMTIVSLDTTLPIQFNRENILLHRATYKEYSIGSQYYQELVKRYPNQEDLIKGILNPISMDVSIAAKDYEILHYDKQYVEATETNLIPKIQHYINLAVDRWYVKDYSVTDPLYPLALLGIIYSFIPAWIVDIRLQNRKTYKAHSFHIWNYLDSYGNLSQYRDFLLRSQVLWLYRNIEWVSNNAGKQQTFEALVANILTPRGIPLGSYTVRHNTKEMPEDLIPNVDAVRYPLNLLDRIVPEPSVNTLRYVMEKSLNLAKNNEDYFAIDLAAAEKDIARTIISETPIKVYESEMLDTTDSQSFKLGDVLVFQWIYWASLKRYNSVINVLNPATSEVMTMSVYDAFIVWLYSANKYNGVELLNVPDIVATDVLRIPQPSFETLRALSEPKYISDKLIRDKIQLQPAVGNIISTEAFNEACHEIHAVMLELEFQWLTRETGKVRANHEMVARAFYADVGIRLAAQPTTYLEYFAMHGWDVVNLNRTDLGLLVNSIYNTALGIDVTNTKTLREIQGALLKLMGQLGTYDTQYIQSINTSPAVPLDRCPILLDGFPQHATQNFNKDPSDSIRVLLPTEGSISFNYDSPDPEITHITDKDVVLEIDLTRNVDVYTKRVRTFTIEAPSLEYDFPGIGNVEDLLFDGTVLDPIITINDTKPLDESIRKTDLDGLDYP